ncbi:bifunctional tetrahydrofolate synthase/dihydrofolate synthase [Litorivicinus lipolyticus]|uniref:Dihydrofolate synthase/folylpolyglutamate synthase n=1 Tax=Litorivicinus lipolyticus TaxID=418701 RepID=A0A5Q2QBU5_9GAMM|nr:Mur ligase family protein [Litorivicinus lipolyticus]QGG79742.1 bifunctional tetrahydrofolate synthase/dihydrofolate synthase [Litorivicinus lipolyticus]
MPRGLNQWIEHLESLNPDHIEMGLERVAAVWARLHDGPINAKVLTITGTNGKGTCAFAAASVLGAAGYRTGLYSSPHLMQFGERIRIDGLIALPDQLTGAFEAVEAARGDIALTYFEFTTLAAFVIFTAAELDVWVLEVGLGGRLDAVNIIDSDVAVITSIGLDHQDWLGDSLHAVATEKVGIARAAKPLVVGATRVPPVIAKHARQLGCRVYQNGRGYEAYTETQRGRPTGWTWQGEGGDGRFHLIDGIAFRYLNIDSLGAAVQALLLLDLAIDDAQIRDGMAALSIPGRFQTHPIANDVTVVFDVAHNPAAGASLRDMLRQQGCDGVTRCVIAMARDKDHAEFIATIGSEISEWYLCDLASARNWDAAKIRAEVLPNAMYFPSPSTAVSTAVNRSRPGDRLLVVGSFMLLADVMDAEELV